MITLALIGLVGGLIAGISPCILPVLPVIFMSSGTTGPAEPPPARGRMAGTRRIRSRALTPYAVVAGLALSFSVFTLLGALVLSALPLPDDLIRWSGLVVLVLLGVGMLVPAVERALERPFARLGAGGAAGGRRGFVLGLALGAVYVPCAGPVLAAITVAGATGDIGWQTVVLTVAFAVGTSLPLLGFALAGRRVAERVRTFRDHQQAVRRTAGVVVIALAVALTFNVTDVVQRAVPDYTSRLDEAVDVDARVQEATRPDAGTGAGSGRALTACAEARSTTLLDCGPRPEITGITDWFNTPDDRPLTDTDLTGKVVLVDFWAYSCINCQRATPHVEAWYERYHDSGLEVIGVHTPEYAFERDPDNVRDGARRLGLTYPVALDPDYATWSAFHNNSWPASYLSDSTGTVRLVAIGEGDYDATERQIRRLLEQARPGLELPPATDVADTTPRAEHSNETYLGLQRAQYFSGDAPLRPGRHTYSFPARIAGNGFVLSGEWTADDESVTSGRDASLAMAFTGSKVYLNLSGEGTITVSGGGERKTYDVSGTPNIYTVVDEPSTVSGLVRIDLSPGLSAYSFTFG